MSLAAPRIPDKQTERELGIDKNCIPETPFKDAILRNLRVLDEQDAIHCGTWHGLPDELDPQVIERILYYRGQGILFFAEELEKFFFLPFAQGGDIDAVGRFSKMTPLTFNGSDMEKQSVLHKDPIAWIPGMVKTPIYQVLTEEEAAQIDPFGCCVVLRDYCSQYSQFVLPRKNLIDPILDLEAECIPYMSTALAAATGISGMQVQTEADQAQVALASQSAHTAALNGQKWIAMTAMQKIQDFSTGSVGTAEQFLVAMQSIDNFRLQLHGIKNGGLFQKQAHELQTESDLKTGTSGSVLQDKTYQRQRFCDIANSIWGDTLFGGQYIWWEPSEIALGADVNLDGKMIDENEEEGGEEDALL